MGARLDGLCEALVDERYGRARRDGFAVTGLRAELFADGAAAGGSGPQVTPRSNLEHVLDVLHRARDVALVLLLDEIFGELAEVEPRDRAVAPQWL